MHPNGEVDRLRSDINHGRTGDKVAWPDPAAAPLGTDEEAAGTPLASDMVRQERMRQTSLHRSGGPATEPFPVAWLGVAALGMVILIAALATAGLR
jgi:hypothetical protein